MQALVSPTSQTPDGATEQICRRFDATQFQFANPKWDSKLQHLARDNADKMGILGSTEVVARASHLLVVPPNASLCVEPSSSHENKFGNLIVQLPSVFEGGELVIHHPGEEGSRACPMTLKSQKHHRQVRYTAFFSQFSYDMKPLMSGACLLVVYSLCWTGDTPLPLDFLLAPGKLFQDLVALYRGETLPLQLERHYTPRDDLNDRDERFVEQLRQAQDSLDLPPEKRFDMFIAFWKRRKTYESDPLFTWLEGTKETLKILDFCGRPAHLSLTLDDLRNGYYTGSQAKLERSEFYNTYKDRRQSWLVIIPYEGVVPRWKRANVDNDEILEEVSDNFESFTLTERADIFLDLLNYDVVPSQCGDTVYADEVFDRIFDLVGPRPDLALRWLKKDPCLHVLAGRAHLFDFWGDEEIRTVVSQLPADGWNDLKLLVEILQAVTPSDPEPWQSQFLHDWVVRILDEEWPEEEQGTWTSAKSLARICLHASNPEHILESRMMKACSWKKTPWLKELDEDLQTITEWDSRYPAIRQRVFQYYPQGFAQVHASFMDCCTEDVEYYLHQIASLPDGPQLSTQIIALLLNPQFSVDARHRILASCHRLPIPGIRELLQVQRTALHEEHRYCRVLPWRIPGIRLTPTRGGSLTQKALDDFLQSPDRQVLVMKEKEERICLTGRESSLIEQEAAGPTCVRLSKADHHENDVRLRRSPDVSLQIGQVEAWLSTR